MPFDAKKNDDKYEKIQREKKYFYVGWAQVCALVVSLSLWWLIVKAINFVIFIHNHIV